MELNMMISKTELNTKLGEAVYELLESVSEEKN